MTIDGVRFVFQNVPASEAPAELTFYLPDLKAYCGAELISHTMHNLYTIRGAKVRDAKKWAQYIDDALTSSAEAEVYFGVHHWPVFGKERIHDFLVKHRDVYRYIHDQTVRLMNAGLTMNEVAEETRLPQSLDAFIDVHGYYGTLTVNAKAVFQYYLGWYDGNPAHLNPLPPREASRRYVQLAGGSEKATAAARAAFDSGDYRWAAQLLNDVVSADPHREEARALLAETYDQLGYAAESAVWRNAYLTGAFELRHGKADRGVDTSLAVDLLQQTPVDRFFDAMAAALNGPRAEDAHLKINFVFTDLRESYVLELSNAVLHHDQAPPAADANATLTLTKGMFLKMVTGAAGVKDMLFSPELHTQGNPLDLVRFFGLFDKPRGGFPIVAPE
jgi:alkyl sulfatase BDS1-like metallo-beta-lactamase superfamily hydrolase